MSNKDIIRAWKDDVFRESLGETTLPEHPAGQIELTDELLSGVQGGWMMKPIGTLDGTLFNGCCSGQCPTSSGC
jgi:mersacidin/lichenicidin family type 2 lantibiotic